MVAGLGAGFGAYGGLGALLTNLKGSKGYSGYPSSYGRYGPSNYYGHRCSTDEAVPDDLSLSHHLTDDATALVDVDSSALTSSDTYLLRVGFIYRIASSIFVSRKSLQWVSVSHSLSIAI
jgi:hypothetical protein